MAQGDVDFRYNNNIDCTIEDANGVKQVASLVVIGQSAVGKGLDVNIQDQTSELIDLYMLELSAAITPNLTQGSSIDDFSITVDSVAGILDTGVHGINISENGKTFQAIVTDVTGLVITFNTPLDIDITTDAIVEIALWNMAVDGSATSRIFYVAPPAGVKWDITRIIFGMTGTAAMDDTTFGPIGVLSKGVVLRIVNGRTKNIFISADNGGLAERMYDLSYPAKVPAGTYALRGRRTFAGQDKNGVVIRLDGDEGDRLEWIIQDDLLDPTFTKFACVAQGHVVEGT